MSSDIPGMELLPGDRVAEYEVQRILGRGGMGSVYLAEHPQIGKKVAIKVLSKQVLDSPEMTARFLREAQVVNRIGHPGLVDIFSFGQLPAGQHYLIMEYLVGESFTLYLQRGVPPWAELQDLFCQLLSALQAAHEAGVVHRDLKPDNVYVLHGRDKAQIKLLDFGLAKIVDDNIDMTKTGIALGTPRYMAPEQSRGGRHVGIGVDIYAVGLMLYEAITGKFPFNATTPLLMLTVKLSEDPPPPSQFAEMPPALEALILRALRREPADRFPSAREMAEALQAVAPPHAQVVIRRRGGPAPTQPMAAPPMLVPAVVAEFSGEDTHTDVDNRPPEDHGGGSVPTILEPPRASMGLGIEDETDAGWTTVRPVVASRPMEALPPPAQSAPPAQPAPMAAPAPSAGGTMSGRHAVQLVAFSAEETRLSPEGAKHEPTTRTRLPPRRGRSVWLATGIAVAVGALCGGLLYAGFLRPVAPRPPAPAVQQDAPADPAPAPPGPGAAPEGKDPPARAQEHRQHARPRHAPVRHDDDLTPVR